MRRKCFADQQLWTFGPPYDSTHVGSAFNNHLRCANVTVDAPAVPRIQIDFERSHDVIAITEINHIGRPLRNHAAIVDQILVVGDVIRIEVIPIANIDQAITIAIHPFSGEQSNHVQISRVADSREKSIAVTRTVGIIIVIKFDHLSRWMGKHVTFANLIDHAIAIVINAVTKFPIDVHWQPTKNFRGKHCSQMRGDIGFWDSIIQENAIKLLWQIFVSRRDFETMSRNRIRSRRRARER